jgi:hypothetical protein
MKVSSTFIDVGVKTVDLQAFQSKIINSTDKYSTGPSPYKFSLFVIV